MQPAARLEHVTVEDYLAGERVSDIKHEYVGGVLYAMAGATKDHNRLTLNVYTLLQSRLRKSKCQAFAVDLKVRLEFLGDDVFYYPDVVVGCDSRDTTEEYLSFPKVICEVLSDSTERLDRREKRWSYQTIETFEEYFIIAQDKVEVTVFRRAKDWQAEVFTKLSDKIELKSLKLSLPVTSISEGVSAAKATT
jgi:Uma2 family endonuclease